MLTENTVFYPVAGATHDELVAEIHQRGPASESGHRYAGYTDWRYHWEFTSRMDGESCVVDTRALTGTIVTTLPEWTNRSAGDPDLRSDWTRYEARLHHHERGHRNIAVMAMNRMAELFGSSPKAVTCDQLREEIQTGIDGIEKDEAAEQSSYDLQTLHGVLQGVWLGN